MQRSLVHHRAGDERVAAVERDRQALEPLFPSRVELACNPDLIGHRSAWIGLWIKVLGHLSVPISRRLRAHRGPLVRVSGRDDDLASGVAGFEMAHRVRAHAPPDLSVTTILHA
jgi:hypothetical protein